MHTHMNVTLRLLGGAGLLLALTGPVAAQQSASIQRQLEELRRIIEQQSRTIDQLQEQVKAVEGQQEAAKGEVEAAAAKAVEEQIKKPPTVFNRQSDVKLTLSGQINRQMNFAADGKNEKFYFLDNNIAVSRLVAQGDARITDDVTGRANIELGLAPNRSDRVSQDSESLSADNGLDFRKVEGVFTSKTYGILAFGKGDPSSKDIARNDLSGTEVASYAAIQDIAGGLLFSDDDTDDYSDTDIADVFTDLDPSRQNRIRYDAPPVAGFTASITGADDQRASAAVRWKGENDAIQGIAGVAISDPSEEDVDFDLAGSGSVLHKGTGLNLTAGAGRRQQEDSKPQFGYLKAGWKADLVEIGSTNFAVDYQRTINNDESSDEGHSVGFVFNQTLRDFGIDLYGGLRWYTLMRDGADADLEDIYVATVGTRIRF